MSETKKTLLNATLVENEWSDQRDWGIDYYLDVNGVRVKLDEKLAEKIMLASGFGEVVWVIDWSKVGIRGEHRLAINPRIRRFAASTTFFPTRQDAEERIKKEIQSRIDTLQGLI